MTPTSLRSCRAPPARPAQAKPCATLVHGAWPELGLAGLLWDGSHLVGLVDGIVAEAAVNDVVAVGSPPVSVLLEAEPAAEGPTPLRLPLITLRTEDRLERSAASPAPPITSAIKASAPVWARLVGTLTVADGTPFLQASSGARIRIEPRCTNGASVEQRGLVMAEGILAPTGQRLVVGCHAVTRAPNLRAAAAAALAAPASAADAPTPSSVPRNGGQPGGPAIALLLGAIAALVVLGFVAWRRGLVQRLIPGTAGDELDDAVQPGEATTAPGVDETSVDLRVPPLRMVEASQEAELPLRS
jgi:hypothetical protein